MVNAQSVAQGVAALYLPQAQGARGAENFTNTINLITNDTSLEIAPSEYSTVDFVQIDGETIGPNIFDATVYGSRNKIFFTQLGNSLLTLTVEGNGNTVNLAELGGFEYQTETGTFAVMGNNNTVSTMNGIELAQLLDIEINGSENLIAVEYSEFAKISGNIGSLAESYAVKMSIIQSGSLSSSELEFNEIEFDIQSTANINEQNTFNIAQLGKNNSLLLNVSGDDQDVDIVQSNTQELPATNAVELLSTGDNSTINVELYNAGSFTLDAEGDSNNITYSNLHQDAVNTENDSAVMILGDQNTASAQNLNNVLIGIQGSFNSISADGSAGITIQGTTTTPFEVNEKFQPEEILGLPNPSGNQLVAIVIQSDRADSIDTGVVVKSASLSLDAYMHLVQSWDISIGSNTGLADSLDNNVAIGISNVQRVEISVLGESNQLYALNELEVALSSIIDLDNAELFRSEIEGSYNSVSFTSTPSSLEDNTLASGVNISSIVLGDNNLFNYTIGESWSYMEHSIDGDGFSGTILAISPTTQVDGYSQFINQLGQGTSVLSSNSGTSTVTGY